MADILQMRNELVVGPLTPQGDGTTQVGMRSGKTGGALVVQAHGALYEAASRGRIRSACNQTSITFGTALTATAVTFTLGNPTGSGYVLSVLSCGLTVITSTTAGSIVYASSAIHTAVGTALGITNNYIGGGSSGVGLASAACTLPAAPVAFRTLAHGPVTATASTGSLRDYVNGGIVIYPGNAVTIQGITIAGTGIIDMQWEELALAV